MLVKRINLALILIFFSFAYAETELELIWNKSLAYSTDVKSATVTLRNSMKAYENRKSLYPVSLKLSTETSFSDVYDEVTWYPTNADAILSVSKTNPYGNSISGGISYGVGRNILNILESVDSDNIGYYHTPEANFSFEQSIQPSFFQGYFSNPEVMLLKNTVKQSEYSKSAIELSVMQNIAELYIQERTVIRQIEKYEKTLNFYDEKIKTMQELYEKSQISLTEIWNLENEKWDCYEDYIEALISREEIELSLKNLSGDIKLNISTKSALPEAEIEVLKYNPSREKLDLEIKNLTLQNILEKQNSAPKISIGGTFSENTETNKYFAVNYMEDRISFNWSFSLGVSFSDFFSPSRKTKQHQYEENLLLYKDRSKILEEQDKNQKENYSELIDSYQRQSEQLKNIIENRTKIKKNYDFLFKNGKCSKLDLEEVCLSVMEAECLYENLKDYLWLYKWQRSQCK